MTDYRLLRRYKLEYPSASCGEASVYSKPVVSSELVLQTFDGGLWKDIPVVDDLDSRRQVKKELKDKGYV